MSNQLQINPIRCDAHGQCAELFPEWIAKDDWGYPIINPESIPGHLLSHAQRAVDQCPRLALALRRNTR
jgi:ferredoxin